MTRRFSSVLMVMVLLFGSIFISACGTEEVTAKDGDTVRVDYTGTLDDGTVFDSSIDPSFAHVEPLEFTIGAGLFLPGFEQVVIGLRPGESTTAHIPAEEAYGPYYEELIITLDWSQFEEGFVPEVGQQLYLQDAFGQTVTVIVLNVSEAGVIVDPNHHLAGEDLTFEITLVEIVIPPTPSPSPTPTPTATLNSP